MEKIVAKQLNNYLLHFNILDPKQSGFRKCHSTESTLLSITDDILWTLDNNKNIQLLLLDLSSAFDTIKHDLLIDTLKMIGISDTVLLWFTSYLQNRYFSIKINNEYSSKKLLSHGVPQGSVLGPILFSIYLLPLIDIFNQFPDINYHLYADDLQIYTELPLHALPSENYSLLNCLNTLNTWFLQNNLILNMSKTSLINFSRVTSIFPPVNVDGQIISPTNSVKNLGFVFDSKLNFIDQISSVCRSYFFNLHKIKTIRNYVPDNICKLLIESTVLSRIEYCNSLYHGLPLFSTNCLNRVIRSSVRLLYRIQLSNHACTSDKLYSMKWLSAKQRSIYKIIMIVYKCLYLKSPKYLKDLLIYRTESRTSRSSFSKVLQYHKFRLARHGKRCFRHSAAVLWNGLPRELRIVSSLERFKRKVKDFIIGNF